MMNGGVKKASSGRQGKEEEEKEEEEEMALMSNVYTRREGPLLTVSRQALTRGGEAL